MDPDELARQLLQEFPRFPVRVERVELPSARPPRRNAKAHFWFEQAFEGGQGKQHGWLKWFALRWLCRGNFGAADYEVEVFIPSVLGKPHGNFRGKVLPKGHRYRWSPGVRFQRADVAYFDRIVEVGVTSGQSLVEPLWCYAVKEAIWLPFQIEDIHADWQDFSREVSGLRVFRGSVAKTKAHEDQH